MQEAWAARELNCSAVAVEASANPVGALEQDGPLQMSHLKARGLDFIPRQGK